jgi:hypothetical protein
LFLFFCSFTHQYFYLHILICIFITKFINCHYFATVGLFTALPPYLICTQLQIFLLCYWLYVCLSHV